MIVESLARRAACNAPSVLEVRDALVTWFAQHGEAQVRKGMRFTAPNASKAEVQRMVQLKARSFFHGLSSTYDQPSWEDLRRVKARMISYLRPADGPQVLERESHMWDGLLVA
ncbi:hypothetical protein AKJ08_0447 [Vulgatibacter incomptus]|uniref:Uncharacterized protein n=1 Tax=Vulgatibacter incomptus TaxID=1391653 RepID=A0A0K1P962_9BACT|nr:hypothetical protein AKJ08_0447 [Vulgatibacter incomptus]